MAVSVFLFNRARDWTAEEPPKVDHEREARKIEKARLVLAGASVVEEEDDLFEGLAPEVSLPC